RVPRARRQELDEARAVVQGRQPARLQARTPTAADGTNNGAESADLLMKLTIYRYAPDKDAKRYYQDYDVPVDSHDRMLLDALVKAKAIDDSLAFRRSC